MEKKGSSRTTDWSAIDREFGRALSISKALFPQRLQHDEILPQPLLLSGTFGSLPASSILLWYNILSSMH
jgi:hypothetical protein